MIFILMQYGGNPSSYGGYTSGSLNNVTEGASFTVDLADADGDGTFIQTEDKTIVYAGSYITTFCYKVGKTEYKFAGSKMQLLVRRRCIPIRLCLLYPL